LYCPADNNVIERNEINKRYQYRKGEYVVIEPEEIKKIEPCTAKAMEILKSLVSLDAGALFTWSPSASLRRKRLVVAWKTLVLKESNRKTPR
jgi:hypothetical protein